MLGYPEPLKTKDIQKIIDDAPYVEKILAAGNKKSYMAQIGYLERQGFNDCFPGKLLFLLEKVVRDPVKTALVQEFFCRALSRFILCYSSIYYLSTPSYIIIHVMLQIAIL